MLAVIHGRKYAKGFRERAPVNGDVLFPFQRRVQIVADKMQANQRFVRVRIANTAHVGDHGQQQVVAFCNALGDGLDDIGLRRLHQATLDLRAVRQRTGNTQRRIFDVIAGCPGDLH